jgi:hypothetical protein
MNMEGIATFLRRQHPHNTALMVEGRTGIPARTVENWLHQANEMRAVHLLALVVAYDAEVFAAAWPSANTDTPGWLQTALAAQELAKIERDRARNETRRLELQAQITAAGGR